MSVSEALTMRTVANLVSCCDWFAKNLSAKSSSVRFFFFFATADMVEWLLCDLDSGFIRFVDDLVFQLSWGSEAVVEYDLQNSAVENLLGGNHGLIWFIVGLGMNQLFFWLYCFTRLWPPVGAVGWWWWSGRHLKIPNFCWKIDVSLLIKRESTLHKHLIRTNFRLNNLPPFAFSRSDCFVIHFKASALGL